MRTEPDIRDINRIYKYRDRIDLEPSFQREKVWPLWKKQCFIDSLLKGWGTPKIYLQSIPRGDGEEDFVCIDGKQRLTTIFAFLEDGFSLNEKFSTGIGEKLYSELPSKTKDAFDYYKLSIEKVIDASEEDIRILFQRLQQGTLLNFGETINSWDGNIGVFSKSLIKQDFFKKIVTLPNTRYSHLAISSQLALLSIEGIVDAKLNNLKTFYKKYHVFNKGGLQAKAVKAVLNYLGRMFPEKSADLRNRPSIISVFVLVSDLMNRGDITGKEKILGQFFSKFMQNLRNEVAKGVNATDAKLINYQSATTQGADKQKSIKIRHQILLQRLVEFDPDFSTIVLGGLTVPEMKFKEEYDKLETHFKSSFSAVDKWLVVQRPKIKMKKLKRNAETLPTYIRQCIHHPRHGKYTSSELSYAITLLKEVVPNLNN